MTQAGARAGQEKGGRVAILDDRQDLPIPVRVPRHDHNVKLRYVRLGVCQVRFDNWQDVSRRVE